MPTKTFLAADLGASSGRVIAGRYDGRTITLEQLNRFDNTPTEIAGTPASAKLHRHQINTATTETTNMAGSRIPSSMPSCGTAAIASSKL